MKTFVFENETLAAEAVCDAVKKTLAEKPDALFCFAAGHSSLAAFAALAACEKKNEIDFSSAWFVGMDEWRNVAANEKGACAYFLRENFLSKTTIPENHIRLFDGLAKSPEAECLAVTNFIRERGGIDYLLLGVGMNGHLALNEPGSDLSLGARLVRLSDTTRQVAPKYFPKEMPPIEEGLTLGIKDLLAAKRIQVVLTGTHKNPVVKRLLANEPPQDFPASVLLKTNAELLLDAAAERRAQSEKRRV